jgi:hypothetical protein
VRYRSGISWIRVLCVGQSLLRHCRVESEPPVICPLGERMEHDRWLQRDVGILSRHDRKGEVARGSEMTTEASSRHLGLRFALGAIVAFCGAAASAAVLLRLGAAVESSPADAIVTPTFALTGRARLLLVGAAAALWFLLGGILAGSSLRATRGARPAIGLAYLCAGALLTILILGVWIGPDASWRLFVLQGLVCALIWTLAGAAAGLLLRNEDAPGLNAAIVGFGLGGLAGGACLTIGALTLGALRGDAGRAANLIGVVLACLVPPLIAGVVMGHARSSASGTSASGPDYPCGWKGYPRMVEAARKRSTAV